MYSTFTSIGALALFFVGLRLSAFFSGVETGFYRVSFLRLSIDAHAGDKAAERILWFARNPSYFVATTLVGNNVANYITTVAIGLGLAGLYHTASGWVELAGTFVLTPVVFICGELLPKNLYYRAPLRFLRGDIPWFDVFYRMFLVVSFPLIWITKQFERLGGLDRREGDLVLGRSRLVQVLDQGHREGLLSDVQNRLIDGLMHTATQPATASMIPAQRVLGVVERTDAAALLKFARRYGLSHVAIRRADTETSWYGYVRVVDATVSRKPVSSLIRPLTVLPPDASKLQALLALRDSGESHAVVCQAEAVLGVVSERGLIEQLFRPPKKAASQLNVPR